MRFEIANLSIDQELRRFVADEILPELPEINLDEESFWRKFSDIVDEMAPENAHLLAERERLQKLIDAYHKERRGAPDIQQYKKFLTEIGYLAPVGDDFSVQAQHIDREVAEMAGPQLVVPVDNARYALNAANARWGSLYDAFYGTDALGRTAKPGGYDKGHGEQVIAGGRKFLDETLPLDGMSWADIASLYVKAARLVAQDRAGREAGLKNLKRFAGYTGSADAPSAILLENNGLLVEIIIDATSPIGRDDAAGISDIHLEAALTAIMDCEDSVAAVDAEDKIAIYRNWLGLMNGNLKATFQKSGRQHNRSLAADKHFNSPNGDKQVSCRGRALMLVRNVGLLMTSDAVLDREGRQVPEGIIDAMITSLIAMYDVGKGGLEGGGHRQNSQAGSIYIVKPKMHGPLEVAFSDKLFGRVEDALGLRRYTLKMGIMDEERRTTVNLKECIRAARHRVFFINTGFLDRTGDEIHTSMQAGAVVRKNKMKSLKWIKAYEDWNVDNGLKAGLLGHAQIGKGMWAMPDLMQKMLAEKINHPQAGATTAWVPSPTAATLHALHYHQIDVFDRARAISKRAAASLEDILTIPLSHGENFSEAEVKEELDNNIQGILGYVVRWVDQGIGCSKVPDINDVGLMEDRATLRISAQHVANWLHHGICTAEQVTDSLHRMARAVDGQNSGDPNYKAMADHFADSFAYQAAQDLIFEGLTQPSGYTEPILHAYRRKVKTSSQ